MKKFEYLTVCQKCKALCCKLGGTNLTKEEVDKILSSGFENNFVLVKEGVYELKSKTDGSCPYLNLDFSCKIQEVKPLVCTCWPIFPEFENGKIEYVLINCPLVKNMDNKEIEKCIAESQKVESIIAESLADENLVSKEELAIICERYKIIEGN